MNQTATFKCPSCGGYLEYDPAGQRFLCPYCGASFNEDELREQSAAKEQQAQADRGAPSSGLRSYHCQSCGAEIVTDDTTGATRCYYCHSPVVLSDRFADEFRPDGVIPFRLDRKQAEEQFDRFVKSKRFIDRKFFSPEQLEDFSGVYYPYWFADVQGSASLEGEGTRVDVAATPSKTITTTRFFRVEREGRLSFRNIARKALKKADRLLSDGVHPYDTAEMKPFAMGYLSGFLAEKRDVEADEVRPEMLQEAEHYADSLMKEHNGLDTLNGKTHFTPGKTDMRYALLPAWVLTYKGGKDGKPYFFMMNGQTGNVCGKLPVDKGRLLISCLAAGAAVFALLCLGGKFIW